MELRNNNFKQADRDYVKLIFDSFIQYKGNYDSIINNIDVDYKYLKE